MSKLGSTTAETVVAPGIGPAAITLFGVEVPILATGISLLALVMMRIIGCSHDGNDRCPARLSWREDLCLTVLLACLLFAAVTGGITGKPLGVGMGVAWAIGLGSSGIMVVEIFSTRVRTALGQWFGAKGDQK